MWTSCGHPVESELRSSLTRGSGRTLDEEQVDQDLGDCVERDAANPESDDYQQRARRGAADGRIAPVHAQRAAQDASAHAYSVYEQSGGVDERPAGHRIARNGQLEATKCGRTSGDERGDEDSQTEDAWPGEGPP